MEYKDKHGENEMDDYGSDFFGTSPIDNTNTLLIREDCTPFNVSLSEEWELLKQLIEHYITYDQENVVSICSEIIEYMKEKIKQNESKKAR